MLSLALHLSSPFTVFFFLATLPLFSVSLQLLQDVTPVASFVPAGQPDSRDGQRWRLNAVEESQTLQNFVEAAAGPPSRPTGPSAASPSLDGFVDPSNQTAAHAYANPAPPQPNPEPLPPPPPPAEKFVQVAGPLSTGPTKVAMPPGVVVPPNALSGFSNSAALESVNNPPAGRGTFQEMAVT